MRMIDWMSDVCSSDLEPFHPVHAEWPRSGRVEAHRMSEHRDIAILGVGMHPWGKWGKNFVDYGVVAARAALADAGVNWRDVQFVSGAATIRNGYPGQVAGATFAQALG